MFREIYEHSLSPSDIYTTMKHLNSVEQLTVSPLTPYQVVLLQQFTASLLCNAAFELQNTFSNTSKNKLVYIVDKISCHMLKLTAKFGCISDRLFLAMYYYKTLRYTEALSVIQMTKVNFVQLYEMHFGNPVAVGGQSWSTKLKHAVSWDIDLDNEINYINELMTEQLVSLQNQKQSLHIPPVVMLHMLEFLCYRHIDSTCKSTNSSY
jgi:hypothetical protein